MKKNNAKKSYFFRKKILSCLCSLFFISIGSLAEAARFSTIDRQLGPNDAVIVAGPDGKILFSHNAKKKLIPASIFKIFTSSMAFQVLGPDYRFRTEFYLTPERHLVVKGYGDPLLISEELAVMAKGLKGVPQLANPTITDLVVDGSYFDKGIIIPGTEPDNPNPYNAPVGALSVNFNTVSFKRNSATGAFESAEPQTPLVPFIMHRVHSAPTGTNRIPLSPANNEPSLYAGHLIKWFLEQEGMHFSGRVRSGKVDSKKDQLIHTAYSSYTLTDIVDGLLHTSNNFTANQLFLTVGAVSCGNPATLDKGIQAANQYAKNVLSVNTIAVSEGSGLSRGNRITCQEMMTLLDGFEPYRDLMRKEGERSFKTGSLSGVSTQAGFIDTPGQGRYRYVVMMNTPGRPAVAVVKKIEAALSVR